MSNLTLISLSIVFGMSFFAGITHLIIGTRKIKAMEHQLFSLLCFLISLIVFFLIIQRSSFHLSIVFAFLFFLLDTIMLLFASYYTRVLRWKLIVSIIAISFISLSIRMVILFKEKISEITSVPTISYLSLLLSNFAWFMIILYISYALILQYKRGEKREAIVLGISNLILILIMVTELLSDLDFISFRFSTYYYFTGIIGLMSFHLSDKIIRMENELIKNEERFRLLVETINEGLLVINKNKNITYANPKICKMLDYTFDEIVKGNLTDFFDEYNLRIFNSQFKKRESGESDPYELEWLKKDGSKIYTIISPQPVFAEDGTFQGSFSVVLDITERKKAQEEKENLEEQLYQAQKMESIGRLAGGIAHDFNNILASIMGYAELLTIKHPDKSNPEGKAAQIILENTERGAELTKQLLGFARKGKYNPVPLNINVVIKDTIKVLENIFKKNVEIIYDLKEKIDFIEADRNQIEQVLANLLINAMDAMPKGGKLYLKTEITDINEEYQKYYPGLKSGNYIKILIRDTGIGIPKENLNMIFEPFFTTKEEGKGTGLGLATVYGIVKNHKGYINVNSQPGDGATFFLYFPVSFKKDVDIKKGSRIVKGNSTILLVDDEENIRQLAETMLTGLGYKVLLAKDGKEAVEIFKKKNKNIDIVLLDIIMPVMSGKETNRKLRKINPDVKVLLSSGFSQNGAASEMMDEGALGFIQKPFRLGVLSEKLEEILKNE